MKRLLGLMVLAFASFGAHSQSWVLPSATITCAAGNQGGLLGCSTAFFGKYLGTTPPGYKAGLKVAAAGYNGATNSTKVMVVSTSLPISGMGELVAAPGPRGGIVLRNTMNVLTNAAAIAYDNTYFQRGIYKTAAESKLPSGFKGATPSQVAALPNLYIGVGTTVTLGFPIASPLVLVSVAPAIDNFSGGGAFYLASGLDFNMYDPSGWGATYSATYTPGQGWSFGLVFVSDSNGIEAVVGPDGTYQSTSEPPTGSTIGPEISILNIANTMDLVNLWPAGVGNGILIPNDPTGAEISIGVSGNLHSLE